MSIDKGNKTQDETIQLIIDYGVLAVSLYVGDKEKALRRFMEEDLPDALVSVAEQHKL